MSIFIYYTTITIITQYKSASIIIQHFRNKYPRNASSLHELRNLLSRENEKSKPPFERSSRDPFEMENAGPIHGVE